MRYRLTFVLIFISIALGFSQETDNNSLGKNQNKFLKYDASEHQLNLDSEYTSLAGAIYSLENFTPVLFIIPENHQLEMPGLKYFGACYSLKYYFGNSDFYILAGPELLVSSDINYGRNLNFGLNAGLGYEVNNNIQIEGRSFKSIYNTSQNAAFETLQLVPLQPISFGFKSKF